jgi:hypothetical protein
MTLEKKSVFVELGKFFKFPKKLVQEKQLF